MIAESIKSVLFKEERGLIPMDVKKITERCDHTILAQCSTTKEVEATCDDAIRYGCASVCIPPYYVAHAKKYIESKNASFPICTVIGFPNGYNTTACKVFEAAEAVKSGADEIDMVINLGMVKEKRYDLVLEEINAVKKASLGRLVKVIIETCFLTEEEIIKLTEVVSDSDADYIKTSTGFGTGGATESAVKLMKKYARGGLKVKAAGGMASLEDAEKFILLGADRLGTSRVVKSLKAQNDGSGGY